MVHQASLVIDTDFAVGPVNRRLFGTFVEHMGRCVYTGIFEPGHPSATPDGFRGDVLALSKDLGVSLVRYPGGNFVSGYDWWDGVGPVEDRPRRVDRAWNSVEPNTIGVDEFAKWAAAAGTETMMAVNLGTRGVQEACDLLEYCNLDRGTRFADRRAANGSAEPYGFPLWCLGNEMDGAWQIGHKTAAEYGRLAAQTAAAMRKVDPSIELVACGSSAAEMPTFGAWEATVLEHTYQDVAYISLHAHYSDLGDLGSFLASAVDMDRFIESVTATADFVRAKGRHRNKVNLSFDEWNVRHQPDPQAQPVPRQPWQIAPAIAEDTFTMADAAVVGSLLNSLLRHCDRVTVACLAQLVNVLAPIRTEPGGPSWQQTTFWPFAAVAAAAQGTSLHLIQRGDRYDTAKYGDVAVLDAAATYDSASDEVALFLMNRSVDEPLAVTTDLRGAGRITGASGHSLADADPTRTATPHTPLRPRPLNDVTWTDTELTVTVPPLSYTVLRVAVAAIP